MTAPSRVWLIYPVLLAFAVDVTLTLTGQPFAYWQGDYESASEANPLAWLLLNVSPWLFLLLSALWAVLLGAIILLGRHPAIDWLAAVLTVAHALGGSSWLVGSSPRSWLLAVLYLVVLSEFSWRCWGRAGWALVGFTPREAAKPR